MNWNDLFIRAKRVVVVWVSFVVLFLGVAAGIVLLPFLLVSYPIVTLAGIVLLVVLWSYGRAIRMDYLKVGIFVDHERLRRKSDGSLSRHPEISTADLVLAEGRVVQAASAIQWVVDFLRMPAQLPNAFKYPEYSPYDALSHEKTFLGRRYAITLAIWHLLFAWVLQDMVYTVVSDGMTGPARLVYVFGTVCWLLVGLTSFWPHAHLDRTVLNAKSLTSLGSWWSFLAATGIIFVTGAAVQWSETPALYFYLGILVYLGLGIRRLIQIALWVSDQNWWIGLFKPPNAFVLLDRMSVFDHMVRWMLSGQELVARDTIDTETEGREVFKVTNDPAHRVWVLDMRWLTRLVNQNRHGNNELWHVVDLRWFYLIHLIIPAHVLTLFFWVFMPGMDGLMGAGPDIANIMSFVFMFALGSIGILDRSIGWGEPDSRLVRMDRVETSEFLLVGLGMLGTVLGTMMTIQDKFASMLNGGDLEGFAFAFSTTGYGLMCVACLNFLKLSTPRGNPELDPDEPIQSIRDAIDRLKYADARDVARILGRAIRIQEAAGFTSDSTRDGTLVHPDQEVDVGEVDHEE